MDFGIYPPEINSGRMYTGPGSGPMLAAAQAWGGLADELYTAASAYQSVVSELTSGSWSGPSSTSMTAAAGPYVEWLTSTAAQAEQLGILASLAALIFVGPSDATTLFGVLPADVLSTIVDFPLAAYNTASGVGDGDTFSGWNGEEAWPGTGPAPVQPFLAPLPQLPPGGFPAPTISAAFGGANMVGGLTVPPSWTVAAPEVRAVAFTTPLTAAPTAAAAPLEFGAAMVGQAMAEPPPPGAHENAKPVTHARLSGHTAGAPADDCVKASPAPRTVVTGVAAAIRDIASQRAEGLLSEEEYNEHKKGLLESSLGQPPLG